MDICTEQREINTSTHTNEIKNPTTFEETSTHQLKTEEKKQRHCQPKYLGLSQQAAIEKKSKKSEFSVSFGLRGKWNFMLIFHVSNKQMEMKKGREREKKERS